MGDSRARERWNGDGEGTDLATTGMRGGGVGDSGAREHRNGDGRIGSLGVGMRGHGLGTAVEWGTCSLTDVGVVYGHEKLFESCQHPRPLS